MKKLKVSEEACIGCGACVAIDPEHFDFNDNGLSYAINQENLETEEIQNAIESCPTSAIAIHEVTENVCECECNCSEECCDCDEECNCECNCDEDCDCSCNNDCDCNCTECNCQNEQ